MATFVVSTTNDSGVGSFRDAIEQANLAPGLDTINFSLTGSLTIRPTTALPTVTDAVVIDGRSQSGFVTVPLVEIDGSAVSGDGLRITAGGSTVRSLIVNRFGGAGIRLDTLGGNSVVGVYVGVDSSGTAARANGGVGVFVASSGNSIGGTASADRNVISANGGDGVQFVGSGAASNLLRNSRIGTNAAGTADLGNGGFGVLINGGSSNTIGGTGASSRNVISGNGAGGVVLLGAGATSNVLTGNFIGTDATGATDLGNDNDGVLIDGGSNNLIGGSGAGAGNTIAFNGGTTGGFDGVAVRSGTGNSILGNNIFSNGDLGIDLDPDGVTLNDATDADTGANDLQNFPIVLQAASSGGQTRVQGRLNSTANSTFTIEFFDVRTPEANGFGEGDRFAGRVTVTTDGTGFASFNTTLNTLVLPGNFVSGTATNDLTGDTSEFSLARLVTQQTITFADLEVTLTASPDPVNAGASLVYTAIVRNNGFSTANNVTLTDVLPASVNVLNVTTTAGTVNPIFGNSVTVDIGTLTVGATAVVTIEVSPTQAGNITNTATVDGSVFDFDPSNDSDSIDVQVVLAPGTSVLSFSAPSYNVGESDNVATITVVRTNSLAGTVSVNFATSDGTAIAGQKYVATSGTLTFLPNEQTKTILVTILDNNILEGNQTINLALSGAAGTSIVGIPRTAVLTVFDNDPPPTEPQTLQFAVADFTVLESDGVAEVTIARTGPPTGTVSVQFATADGTGANPAIAGRDYVATLGSVTFNNGETSKTFQVPLINNNILEPARAFNVSLSNTVGAVLGSQTQATVTILDDESPSLGFFQFASSSFVALENSGSATITITRSGGVGAALVQFFTDDGTASAGVRYLDADQPIVFGASEVSKTVAIPLINTNQFEGNQTVFLSIQLASPNAALGNPATAVLTIVDDEVAPAGVIEFAAPLFLAGEADGTAAIALTRTLGTGGAVTVRLRTTGGTAVAGVDYLPLDVVVPFADGQATAVVPIAVFDNLLIDPNKTVGLLLSDPTGGVVLGGQSVAVLSIANNDVDLIPPVVTDLSLVPIGRGIGGARIRFSEAMNPFSLINTGSYTVVAAGRDNRFGTRDDSIVPIALAAPDATATSVTLAFGRNVPVNQFLQIIIPSAPGGPADPSGNLLDGDFNGVAGGAFVSTLARTSSLSYTDRNGDIVTFTLRGGGTFELSRFADGEGNQLRLFNTRPFRSVLSGTVRRPRGGGGDGVTSLQQIFGIDPFGVVRSELATPPFFVRDPFAGVVDGNPILTLGAPTIRRRR